MQTLILSPTTPHAGASVSTNGRYHELTFWLDYMADNASPVFAHFRKTFELNPVYIEVNGIPQRVTRIEQKAYVLMPDQFYFEVVTDWGNVYNLQNLSDANQEAIAEAIIP